MVGGGRMTKILILSDIHANFHALSAVMGDAVTYDLMLCAGDMVGYYDQPNEVCDYLRSFPNAYIKILQKYIYAYPSWTPSPFLRLPSHQEGFLYSFLSVHHK